MSIKNIYSAESWTKIYQAFSQINFTSYTYDDIKASLISYMQVYYPESFNDFIESSELMVIIESFSYIAEQLAYRVDMLSHESFITTAQRKQSILKLAKLISYKPARNIPARGLVKITSISTSEKVLDSQGNNLAGSIIIWNDPNNAGWKEQFFLVLNRTLTSKFGQYSSSQQVGNVVMQLYTFNNTLNSIRNGVYSFIADTGLESFPMEVVPVLLDTYGPYEKTPDINSRLSVIYSSDGLGDSSDYTGLLMHVKQGILSKLDYEMTSAIPNRALDINTSDVNETDVWVNRVDSNGNILEIWHQVETIADQNLTFNTNTNRKKFEVETLENDAVKLVFGDGDFSDIPVGTFNFWVRQSANRNLVIPPNKLVNQQLSFQYVSSAGAPETCSLTFSLTATIQNSAPSESIEHIRQSAPSTYYAQNRMVNAQDHNTFMLKDQSILRLVSINRTFAGQPKYIEWNDASGQYQNVKLFGDDLKLSYELSINSLQTGSEVSSRSLLDAVIEPLLSTTGIINLLTHISATDSATSGVVSLPRRTFIENNRQIFWSDSLSSVRTAQLEKTLIQGAIDQHWYGEPTGYTTINGTSYAIIQDPGLHPEDDSRIWNNTVARTIDGVNPFIAGDIGSGLQPQAWQQKFGLTFKRILPMIADSATIIGTVSSRVKLPGNIYQAEVFSVEVAADKQTLYVTSNLRGNLGNGEIGKLFSLTNTSSPLDFTLAQSITSSYPLQAGDAFIITLPESLVPDAVDFDSTVVNQTIVTSGNLLGRWEIIRGTSLPTTGPGQSLPFDPTPLPNGDNNPNSWIIWVEAKLNDVTQQPISFTVYYRELKLIASSANTKFWYNSNQQLIDAQTKNPVYDVIRVLRSNLTADGMRVIGQNENYDVVGPVVDSSGVVNLHKLEVIPTNLMTSAAGSTTVPDNILQFENFVDSSNTASPAYKYFKLDEYAVAIAGSETLIAPSGITFNRGAFVSNEPWDNSTTPAKFWARQFNRGGLDFMWQHFTPYNNLIDPSVSNIHDTYILTQGYYNAITSYIQGKSNFLPAPPTPLELRNQYRSLLESKMLSDTIVLHPGKIKLLFGALAEPQLRAKFKVVKSASATLTDERIRTEVLSVINSYFGIQNWDFGEQFYATELFSMIHQRLPTEVASVVLVPVYAVNSFGSLFSVQCGINEILQSAAQFDDIEIVTELNSSTLRQLGNS